MNSFKIVPNITRRDTNSFRLYLNDVTKIKKPLQVKEEKELIEKIKNGDTTAEEELIKRNLRFVISVAKHYQYFNTPIGDIVNDGNIGLIIAARKFDNNNNNKFISYAVHWIRQSILQGLLDNDKSIKIPQNRITQISKIKKARNKLQQKLSKEPSMQEIINETGLKISVKEAEKAMSVYGTLDSIDSEIGSWFGSKDSYTLKDIIPSNDTTLDNRITEIDTNSILDIILEKLPPRNKEILIRYYGLNGNKKMTYDEISLFIGISKERVRQIRVESIKKLKKIIKVQKKL